VKKQPKPWVIFSGLVFQIAIIMFLLTNAGTWLDNYYNNQSGQFTIALSLLGVIVVLIMIISQTKDLK